LSENFQSTSPPDLRSARALRALPKAHLHLHFEAAARRASLGEAAHEARSLPAWTAGSGFEGFAEAYLGMIDFLAQPGMFDVAFDAAAHDAEREGVVYVEFAVSPHFYANTFGTSGAALAEMAAAADRAMQRRGVGIGLMLTVDRTLPVAHAEEIIDLAIAWKSRGVVSVGAANDERSHPLAPFAADFRRAAEAGLTVAPHAGELVGPDSIRDALAAGASRIEHGIRAIEDPALLDELARRDVCLDVCPTSNVLLGVVPALSEHPLPALIRAGVPCTINADDPTILEVSILDEYTTARNELHLSDGELAECARTSIRFSSLNSADKRRALDEIDAWQNTPLEEM
jgi:adenosine deaminase